MSFDWDHYLALAEDLWRGALGSKDGEASFRSAISRAYYAAFHEGRIYLKDRTLAHVRVFERLRDSPSRKDKQLFEAFKLMRRNREDADYDKDKTVNAKDAEKVILSAKKFIKLARM